VPLPAQHLCRTHSRYVFWLTNDGCDGQICLASDRCGPLLGWAAAELTGRAPRCCHGPRTDARTLQEMEVRTHLAGEWLGVLTHHRRDGAPLPLNVYLRRIPAAAVAGGFGMGSGGFGMGSAQEEGQEEGQQEGGSMCMLWLMWEVDTTDAAACGIAQRERAAAEVRALLLLHSPQPASRPASPLRSAPPPLPTAQPAGKSLPPSPALVSRSVGSYGLVVASESELVTLVADAD